VQATATEAGAVFFAIRPSDVLSKYQGDSERYLRSVFDAARSVSTGRAIVFFDGELTYLVIEIHHASFCTEFDSIALARGGADEGAQARRLLSELLVQLTHNKTLQQENRMGAASGAAESKPSAHKSNQQSAAKSSRVNLTAGVKRTFAQHR
jgi:SpoVK/Ycf46/Vps4 family AAA+-type ATPase